MLNRKHLASALLLLSLLAVGFVSEAPAVEETTEPNIVVKAADPDEFEDLGGYDQPQWVERSQVSFTTKLYVLSPYEFFVGFFSESDFYRLGKSFHDLSQEIEVGLPYRLEVGFENHIGLSGRRGEETFAGVEARYAFATWGAIPLNPAISAAYKFGLGNRPGNRIGASENQPDSYELRILLGQGFFPRFQWAFNGIYQHELSGSRNRESGFNSKRYVYRRARPNGYGSGDALQTRDRRP